MHSLKAMPITTPLPRGAAGFVAGVAAFLAGLKLVAPGGGLFRYAIAPVVVSLIVLVALVAGAVWLSVSLLQDWLAQIDWAPWLAWLGGLLALLVAGVVAYFLFSPVMTLFAPVFIDPICEQVHLRYTGQPLIGQRSAQAFARRQWFALLQSLKWLAVTLVVELPLALVALLTGIGAFIALPVSAMIRGADLMDNPHACRQLPLRAKLRWVVRNPAATLGLGAAAVICLLVPVVNLFTIPAGAAAATLMMLADAEYSTADYRSDASMLRT